MAARCAAEQGRYWEYHDLLFVAQPAFERSDLILSARRLGLPLDAFTACLDGGRYLAAVRKDVQEGRAAGVTGTPTFFVNGLRLVGIQPYDMFREAVQGALDDAQGQRPGTRQSEGAVEAPSEVSSAGCARALRVTEAATAAPRGPGSCGCSAPGGRRCGRR